ncbi:MAG: hypothetical protein ACI4MY_00040 [Christensenellales bacterium]
MNIFEEFMDKVLSLFENDIWVKWIHDGTKFAYTQKDKEDNIEYASKSNHCAICLNINGCCFPINNMPRYPLHFNCHCRIVKIKKNSIRALCDLSKFNRYIFHPDINVNKGKKALFESWGYDIMDSEKLQNEFISQAQEKYANGDFILGELNSYGQRILIEIVLPRKNEIGTINLVSSWMVYPDGLIKLITPYAGR